MTDPALPPVSSDSPNTPPGPGIRTTALEFNLGHGLRLVLRSATVHPADASEPFHAAANTIGDVLRDLAAAGARPLAAVQALRLGDLLAPEMRRGFASSVAGFARYANRFGLPCVATAVEFQPGPHGPPRLDVFGLGVAAAPPTQPRPTPHPPGVPAPGDLLVLVGSPIGPDGLGAHHPSVPVGDPCLQRSLVDLCLDLIATNTIRTAENVGAEGLAAAALRAARGAGIDLDLDRIPLRSPNLPAPDRLLARSQEVMLLVVPPDRIAPAASRITATGLPWTTIGTLTDSGVLSAHCGDQPITRMILPTSSPNPSPTSTSPGNNPANPESPANPGPDTNHPTDTPTPAPRLEDVPDTREPLLDLRRLLADPSLASRNWVHSQYDHTAGNLTLLGPGHDAAVLRIPTDDIITTATAAAATAAADPQAPIPDRPAETTSNGGPPTQPQAFIALAVVAGAFHPGPGARETARTTIAEAALSLACVGARPLALALSPNPPPPPQTPPAHHQPPPPTDSEGFLQGLTEACRHLRVHPPEPPLTREPSLTMIGQLDDPSHLTSPWFRNEGDTILLLGQPCDPADPLQGLGTSAHWRIIHGRTAATPPPADLDAAALLQTALRGLILAGGVLSARTCSRGGIAAAIAASCLAHRDPQPTPKPLGAAIDLTACRDDARRTDSLLFGETPARILVSCAPLDAGKIVERARILGVPALPIGTVGGDDLRVRIGDVEHVCPLKDLHDAWWNAIATAMD
jgi:phosphoribosylformylglycinamidine synthase